MRRGECGIAGPVEVGMLRTRNDQSTLWEAILPDDLLELPELPELPEVELEEHDRGGRAAS